MISLSVTDEGTGTCSASDKENVAGFYVIFEGDKGESFLSDKEFVKQVRFQLRKKKAGGAKRQVQSAPAPNGEPADA